MKLPNILNILKRKQAMEWEVVVLKLTEELDMIRMEKWQIPLKK